MISDEGKVIAVIDPCKISDRAGCDHLNDSAISKTRITCSFGLLTENPTSITSKQKRAGHALDFTKSI